MLWNEFAAAARDAAQTPKKLAKAAIIGALFSVADDQDLVVLARYFSAMAFPAYDERVLSIGGAAVRTAILAIVPLSADQWQQLAVQYGDLGDAAAVALAKVGLTTPTLTVQAVQSALEALAVTRGSKQKTLLLEQLIRQTTPLGATFLIKLLGGELRIGVREGTVEDAIARTFNQPLENVRRAHMLLGDIGQTALLARQDSLAHATMNLFHPIKFMLASPIDELESVRRSITATMLVEDKYDGIRAQAHHSGQRTVLYSRTLDQVTGQFPEIAQALTQLSDTVIIDGEIVAATENEILPFNQLQKRLGRKQVSAEVQAAIPVVFVMYDLLFYNGQVLLDMPLAQRRALLERLDLAEPLRRSTLVHETQLDRLDDLFDKARERGNEGLMVKSPDSLYVPGRRGREWLKLKKALATLDVVVTAAEVGHGKRRSVLSDYTFAVRRSATDPTLLNIGKAYSGLTDQEIAQLTDWFKAHTLQRFGRVHLVEPEIVLEVAFDGVQASPRHKSGFALRFPRIVRLRPDKPVAEIDTLETVQQLAG